MYKSREHDLISQVDNLNKEYFKDVNALWDSFSYCIISLGQYAEIEIAALREMRLDARSRGYKFICPL